MVPTPATGPHPADLPPVFDFPNPDRWEIDSLPAADIRPTMVTKHADRPQHISASDVTARPDFHWTWLLLDRGFSPAECRAIRRLDEGTFLSQLQRAASEFYHVKWEWGLTAEQQQAFAAVLETNPEQVTMPAPSQLPAGTRREHWELFLVLQSAD
jgi:hypothetical protein